MPATLVDTLTDIVGRAHCLCGADRSRFVVEGRTPGAVVFAGSVEEVGRVVAAAAAARVAVIPWGGGTLMHLGAPPPDGAVVVVTRRLNRIVEHEPGDLTATVEAGVTLEALETGLGAKGQWWPLDPPAPSRATLGGVLSANASGPRRHLYGTARDLVIGIRVVGADGTVVRGGGKVVKNVAGYDLVKLYIGALGTLGVIVEATLKLRPRPEADRACWATFDDVGRAGAGVAAVLASDLLPHALELLDPGAAEACGAGAGLPAEARAGAVVLLGFDGLATTVAAQAAEADRLLRGAGARAVRALDEAGAAQTFAAIRHVRADVGQAVAVATVGVPPAAVAAYVSDATMAVRGLGLRLMAVAHAGQGIVTCLVSAGNDERPSAALTGNALGWLRERARGLGGHCVIEWAPLGVKEAVSVWDPPGPAFRVMREVKARLDPNGVLNPGRFMGGL